MRLAAQRLTDGVENVEEVARDSHFAEQRYFGQHLHLLVRDVVGGVASLVVKELLPRRGRIGLRFGPQQRLGSRIG